MLRIRIHIFSLKVCRIRLGKNPLIQVLSSELYVKSAVLTLIVLLKIGTADTSPGNMLRIQIHIFSLKICRIRLGKNPLIQVLSFELYV